VGLPEWFWLVFVFAIGGCVGSFLNVVIYRLPRDKSVMTPPSACPACGRPIRFYDNIPLVSWVVLRAKCRYCRARISVRYFVIELLTAFVFLGFFILFFHSERRAGVPPFLEGGWLIYLVSIVLSACLIAASAIDLELWVIPISVCWFATAIGLILSTLGVYIIEPNVIQQYVLLPSASPRAGSLAAGAAIGLAISWALLITGVFKRSYESQDAEAAGENEQNDQEKQYNHRLEICKEIVFLLPVVICSGLAHWAVKDVGPVRDWWVDFSQQPAIAGLLGSLWGYFVGCGIVWAARILGTLGLGREAMGLGDVHLMGAAGAVIGPVLVVVAFFVAPFFGLAWAGFQMFFKKTRQIPYGPFLSLGMFAVMIAHDAILGYWSLMLFH
jgi:leader peptidase (prepilin peptidase)/N-methyltransferase